MGIETGGNGDQSWQAHERADIRHTRVVRSLGGIVGHLKGYQSGLEIAKAAELEAIQRQEEFTALFTSLHIEIQNSLDELDLVERRIHFTKITGLMELEVLPEEYDPDRQAEYVANARGHSYYTGNKNASEGIILGVIADPNGMTLRDAGLIVQMPDDTICFMKSSSDNFIVGDKVQRQ